MNEEEIREEINRPEFFDIFGVLAFTFIIIISLLRLFYLERLFDWVIMTLLVIGILGLIVDGRTVIKRYLL